jgi:hypothetical protein
VKITRTQKRQTQKQTNTTIARYYYYSVFATFVFSVFLVFFANAASAQWGATRMDLGQRAKALAPVIRVTPPTSPPLSMIAQGKAQGIITESDPADTRILARLMVPGNHPFLEAIGREGRGQGGTSRCLPGTSLTPQLQTHVVAAEPLRPRDRHEVRNPVKSVL